MKSRRTPAKRHRSAKDGGYVSAAEAAASPETTIAETVRPRPRTTHTYVELAVSRATFDEIAGALRAADYGHAFIGDAIDMHGIALVTEKGE